MRAVVFDCDGVLIDSEPVAWQAWVAVLTAHDYDPGEADRAASTGIADREVHRLFAARMSLPDWDDVRRRLEAEMDRRRAQIATFPDAFDTVSALAAWGVPLAVASSTDRRPLLANLERAGLSRFFDVVVGGDEVAAAKPAPDLYLAAAAGLGVSPTECLAVEDSHPGVAAARAAGMRVVVVQRPGAAHASLGGVSSLDPELIRQWLG